MENPFATDPIAYNAFSVIGKEVGNEIGNKVVIQNMYIYFYSTYNIVYIIFLSSQIHV